MYILVHRGTLHLDSRVPHHFTLHLDAMFFSPRYRIGSPTTTVDGSEIPNNNHLVGILYNLVKNGNFNYRSLNWFSRRISGCHQQYWHQKTAIFTPFLVTSLMLWGCCKDQLGGILTEIEPLNHHWHSRDLWRIDGEKWKMLVVSKTRRFPLILQKILQWFFFQWTVTVWEKGLCVSTKLLF